MQLKQSPTRTQRVKEIDSFILMNSIKITDKNSDGTLYGANAKNYYQINHEYYVTTPKVNPECPTITPIDASTWCENAQMYLDYRGNTYTKPNKE